MKWIPERIRLPLFLVAGFLLVAIGWPLCNDIRYAINLSYHTTTESGLKFLDEKIGHGQIAKTGDRVVIHFTGHAGTGSPKGSFYGGSKQELNIDTEPLELLLSPGQEIQGLADGVVGMKEGGERKLIIPPELGCGANFCTGVGHIVLNSELHLVVELLKVHHTPVVAPHLQPVVRMMEDTIKTFKPLAKFYLHHQEKPLIKSGWGRPIGVTFQNCSPDAVDGWWDFGDSPGGLRVPFYPERIQVRHMYQNAGSYTVKLTVRNAAGEEDVRTVVVDISENPVLLARP